MERKCNREFDFSIEKSIQALLGMSNEEFEAELDCFSFWASLLPTTDAKQIFEIVNRYFQRENVYLISSSQQTPNAMCGCLAWYKKYTPVFYREGRIIFCKNKFLLSDPGKILIDDHLKTCQAFGSKGGWTVLMSRPWNIYNKVVNPLEKLDLELKMILHIHEEEALDGQERIPTTSAQL
jgi:hypothetical protein